MNESTDFVQNYIETQQKNARLLGVILKSIVLRRLNRWFEFFQTQLVAPTPTPEVLYNLTIGVTYLLSSRIYQRYYQSTLEKKRRTFQRLRSQTEVKLKAEQRKALNYSPRNLFRFDKPPVRL